jgi:translocator protein
MSDWLPLAGFLILTLAVGGVAGAVTAGGVRTWYPTLIKPSFNPPNWVFAPVWTVLYVLMAIAAWRVWQRTSLTAPALLLFYAQLVLNAAWSAIFFKAHRIGAALVDIALLLAAIVSTTVAFWSVDPIAAVLLLPYLAWVCFAAMLNGALWQLNRARQTPPIAQSRAPGAS